jgi:protein SCO1/2
MAALALGLTAGVLPPAPARAQLIRNELPAPVRGLELKDHLGQTIPVNLEFTDSDGRQTTLEGCFTGARPVVMVMVYLRCPMLCPKVLQEVADSLNGLDFTVGKDFDAVIVSFDPRDGPTEATKAKSDMLINYHTRVAAESVRKGFRFLTGSAESARALADSLGFAYRFLPESGEFSHGTAIYVLTPKGRISRVLPRLDYPVKDLRLALLEAGGGQIGSAVDLFTLWCYHYDPASGTYTVQAVRIMRIGATLSALTVGSIIGWLAYGERRRRRAGERAGAVAQAAGVRARGAERGEVVGGVAGGGQLMGHAR